MMWLMLQVAATVAPLRDMFRPASIKEQLNAAGLSWNYTSVKKVVEAVSNQHPQLRQLIMPGGAAAAEGGANDDVGRTEQQQDTGGSSSLALVLMYKDVWAAAEPLLEGEQSNGGAPDWHVEVFFPTVQTDHLYQPNFARKRAASGKWMRAVPESICAYLHTASVF
jgi:hypothetical protein